MVRHKQRTFKNPCKEDAWCGIRSEIKHKCRTVQECNISVGLSPIVLDIHLEKPRGHTTSEKKPGG